MMGVDDLPTDPERAEREQISRGQGEKDPGQESANDASRSAEEARAAADEPFDRLRAELRRPEIAEQGWRHRRPWRWLAGWWRKADR
jgi:hypothetical protein